MKRTTSFILAVFLFIAFSVVSFADNIYIVDDEEPVFVPDVQETTTSAPETTTAQSSGGIFGDMGQLEDYFGDFKDFIGGGVESILGGFGDLGDLGDLNIGGEATTSPAPPSIDSGDAPTYSNQAGQMVQNTKPSGSQNGGTVAGTTSANEENTTQKSEVHSVLIVQNGKDEKDGLSGSTLTLLVFVAAIVIIILAAAIILVVMTKRTEHNSAVMDKSTIPGIAKPRGMSGMMNDNIGEDGNDYGNIAYWND